MNLQNFRIEPYPLNVGDFVVVSVALAFLTMPFKGTNANSLKVGK